MKLFKIEFAREEYYVIDVLAENEEEAKKKASVRYNELLEDGTLHYNESRDPETSIYMTCEVTNTDDPFNE